MVRYVEMTIEEAMKRFNKNKKVLVAVQDLESDDVNINFVKKGRNDCEEIFRDVETAALFSDDWVKQLRLFTVKQYLHEIKREGLLKIVLLKDLE